MKYFIDAFEYLILIRHIDLYNNRELLGESNYNKTRIASTLFDFISCLRAKFVPDPCKLCPG